MKNYSTLFFAVIVAILVVGLSALLLTTPEMTAEERLESQGFCDVVYLGFEDGHEVQNTNFFGATPLVALAVVWYDDAPTMTLTISAANPALIEWLAEVVEVVLEDENPWRLIEIDILYERNSELLFAGTIIITRACWPDENTKVYLGDVDSEDAIRMWLENGYIMVVNNAMYGFEYRRGINLERKAECATTCPLEN